MPNHTGAAAGKAATVQGSADAARMNHRPMGSAGCQAVGSNLQQPLSQQHPRLTGLQSSPRPLWDRGRRLDPFNNTNDYSSSTAEQHCKTTVTAGMPDASSCRAPLFCCACQPLHVLFKGSSCAMSHLHICIACCAEHAASHPTRMFCACCDATGAARTAGHNGMLMQPATCATQGAPATPPQQWRSSLQP